MQPSSAACVAGAAGPRRRRRRDVRGGMRLGASLAPPSTTPWHALGPPAGGSRFQNRVRGGVTRGAICRSRRCRGGQRGMMMKLARCACLSGGGRGAGRVRSSPKLGSTNYSMASPVWAVLLLCGAAPKLRPPGIPSISFPASQAFLPNGTCPLENTRCGMVGPAHPVPAPPPQPTAAHPQANSTAEYGCCPSANASCCGHGSCCPGGYACAASDGACVAQNSTAHPYAAVVPQYRLCPGIPEHPANLSAPDWKGLSVPVYSSRPLAGRWTPCARNRRALTGVRRQGCMTAGCGWRWLCCTARCATPMTTTAPCSRRWLCRRGTPPARCWWWRRASWTARTVSAAAPRASPPLH